jgi:hypothetical protein
VALIERRAYDVVGAITRTIDAGICLGTSIAVATGRTFGRLGIGTHARRRIAGARDVALIGSCAYDRIVARTRAHLTGIGLRAKVAIVARGAFGHEPIGRTNSAAAIACFLDVALPR